MTDSIKMPPDLMQLPQFRQLGNLFGNACQALMAWWLLFQQLKYLAQEGSPAGRIQQNEVELFKKTLADTGKENGLEWSDPNRATLFDLLVEVKLLKADGPDWICPRFQVLNAEQFGRGMASMGGSMKAFRHRQQTLDADAMQQSLSLAESKFVDEEDAPLPPELVKRVTRLVIACDNALFKPHRPKMLFTEGLIQEALRVCRKYEDAQIDLICEVVARKREHPALMGMTTERLLPQFGDMAPRLE